MDADAPGPVPDRSALAMTGLRFRPPGPDDAIGLLALKKRLDSETSFMLLEPDERTEDSANLLVDGRLVDELHMAKLLPRAAS